MRSRTQGHFETWEVAHGGHTEVFALRRNKPPAPARDKKVVIIIPGNPGIVHFYKTFAESLFNNSSEPNLDIFVLQHVGHSRHDFEGAQSKVRAWNTIIRHRGSQKTSRKHTQPLSLDEQINHKVIVMDYILAMYPKGTNFILAGHSIGAFISLQILRQRPAFPVHRVILLFPTLRNIADTPNGRVIRWIAMDGVRHSLALVLMVLRPLLMIFPIVFYSLVSFMTGMTGEMLQVACDKLLHHTSGLNALTLGNWEMKQVQELDEGIIAKYHDKLVLYYGPQDKWADESHFLHMKFLFPEIQAILCSESIPHDFVVHHSEVMARKVAKWL